MAPKKAVRKRALSSTADSKARNGDAKRLRTRTPVKKPTADKDIEEDWQSDESSEGGGSDGSDFEEENEVLEESDDEDEEAEEPTSEEEDYGGKSRRRSKGGSAKGKKVSLPTRNTENGAGSKVATTGYGVGVEVITKKVKARPAGNVRYTDDTIHPNTMLFLGDLAANNRRDWLKSNDPDYRASLADFNSFIEKLSERISEIDDTIPELPIKDLVFRIHRDVRFSKDPTPYKTNFGAAWSRTGRKGPFAKYYMHIGKGNCIVAGGLWQPESTQVAALRRDIDRRPNRIKQVLRQAGLRKDFLGGVADDEKKVVKKFIESRSNKENALKVRPKGYDSDHPNIDLIRLRNYTVSCRFDDDLVVGEGGLERLAAKIRSLVPFITYLNSVVMPDDEEDGEDEE